MPSAKRPRGRRQLAALRRRIKDLENQLAESRQPGSSLRRVDAFIGGQFGPDRTTLVAFSADMRGVRFVGEYAEGVLGCGEAQLMADASAWMRYVVSDDLPPLYEALATVVEGQAAEVAFRTMHHQSVRWIRARFAVNSQSAEPACVVGFFADVSRLKGSEEAIRTSEERFRLLASSAPIGIYMSDARGHVVYLNPRLEEIYGHDPADLLGLGFTRIFPPADRQEISAEWLQVSAVVADHDVERCIVNGRGERRWIHSRSVPLISNAGKCLGRIGTVEDITERRVAEQELRESEERFRMLAEHATDIISTHGADATCRYVSPACRTVLGFEPEEILGKHPKELVHPDDWANVLAANGPQGSPFMMSTLTYRCRHKDGHYVWLETMWKAIPGPLRVEHATNIVALSRDVTVRRQAAERLQASEARLRAILDTASDGIVTIDESGTIEQFNPGAEHLFGYRAEEVLGQSIQNLLVDPADAEHGGRARRPGVFRRPLARTRGIIGRHKDGGRFELEISVGESVIGGRSVFTGILHDVSQRMRTERRLRENEKLAATGRIAARVAHEINNPLAGIKNSFLLLRDSIPPNDPYFHYVTRIETEIDRIARIVRRMFDLHRPSRVTLERIDVRATLRDLAALLASIAQQHQVALRICADESARSVMLSEDSFRQVLYAVVVNAIEASPPGGEVRIVARTAAAGLDVWVEDRGTGIAPEIQHQVYEPFYTTKSQLSTGGLGLGLSIARGIVEAMSGTLEFHSECGQGTTFHINFPVFNHDGEASHESHVANPVR